MDSGVLTGILTAGAAVAASYFTYLATRNTNDATAKKTHVEAAVLQTREVNNYAEAANTLATAHQTAEEGWRKLVQGLAAEIDRYKLKEKEYEVRSEKDHQRIGALEEQVYNERQECDLKIKAVEDKWNLIREQDRRWFIEALTNGLQNK